MAEINQNDIDQLKSMQKPPLTFEFKGEHPPIKMTYGLEMDLRRMLPDPIATMQLLQNDVFTQDYVIRRCLTDKKGIITSLEDLVPSDQIDLDEDEIDGLLMWAAEHALYFFVKRTAGIGELGVRFQNILPQPQASPPQAQSTAGSPISTLTTQSAGDSTA